jgi:hypothetical protein
MGCVRIICSDNEDQQYHTQGIKRVAHETQIYTSSGIWYPTSILE